MEPKVQTMCCCPSTYGAFCIITISLTAGLHFEGKVRKWKYLSSSYSEDSCRGLIKPFNVINSLPL